MRVARSCIDWTVPSYSPLDVIPDAELRVEDEHQAANQRPDDRLRGDTDGERPGGDDDGRVADDVSVPATTAPTRTAKSSTRRRTYRVIASWRVGLLRFRRRTARRTSGSTTNQPTETTTKTRGGTTRPGGGSAPVRRVPRGHCRAWLSRVLRRDGDWWGHDRRPAPWIPSVGQCYVGRTAPRVAIGTTRLFSVGTENPQHLTQQTV